MDFVLGVACGIFLKTFSNPVKKRIREISPKESSRVSPTHIIPACAFAAVLWARRSDPAIAPSPPNPPISWSCRRACHHANAKRYVGLLLLLCLLSHQLTRCSRATPSCCAKQSSTHWCLGVACTSNHCERNNKGKNHKNPSHSHSVEFWGQDSRESPQSWDSQLIVPRNAHNSQKKGGSVHNSQKKGVQFGNPAK